MDKVVKGVGEQLWFMNGFQLARLEGDSLKVVYDHRDYDEGTYQSYFYNMDADTSGVVYCITSSGIMWVDDNDVMQPYYVNDQLTAYYSNPNISIILLQPFCIDSKNTIYFSLKKNVYSVDKNKKLNDYQNEYLYVKQFVKTGDGKVIVSNAKHLYYINKDSLELLADLKDNSERVEDFAFAKDNDVWVVGKGGSIEKFSNNEYQYTVDDTKQNNFSYLLGPPYIKNLLYANNGALWVNLKTNKLYSDPGDHYFVENDSVVILDTKNWDPLSIDYMSESDLNIDSVGVYTIRNKKKFFLVLKDSIDSCIKYQEDLYILRNGELYMYNNTDGLNKITDRLQGSSKKLIKPYLEKKASFAIVENTLFLFDGGRGLYYFLDSKWRKLSLDQISRIHSCNDKLYIFSNHNIVETNHQLQKFHSYSLPKQDYEPYYSSGQIDDELIWLRSAHTRRLLFFNGKDFQTITLPRAFFNSYLVKITKESNGIFLLHFERTLLRLTDL